MKAKKRKSNRKFKPNRFFVVINSRQWSAFQKDLRVDWALRSFILVTAGILTIVDESMDFRRYILQCILQNMQD